MEVRNRSNSPPILAIQFSPPSFKIHNKFTSALLFFIFLSILACDISRIFRGLCVRWICLLPFEYYLIRARAFRKYWVRKITAIMHVTIFFFLLLWKFDLHFLSTVPKTSAAVSYSSLEVVIRDWIFSCHACITIRTFNLHLCAPPSFKKKSCVSFPIFVLFSHPFPSLYEVKFANKSQLLQTLNTHISNSLLNPPKSPNSSSFVFNFQAFISNETPKYTQRNSRPSYKSQQRLIPRLFHPF